MARRSLEALSSGHLPATTSSSVSRKFLNLSEPYCVLEKDGTYLTGHKDFKSGHACAEQGAWH